MIGAIPDPNVALRPRWNPVLDMDLTRALRLFLTRRRLGRLRLMFFGIRPPYRKLGVDAVLFHEVMRIAGERGYHAGEASMLLEENDLILRAASSMGGRLYKTWRVYEMPIP
jgi:GNAT superfamily N-acetyltransferase